MNTGTIAISKRIKNRFKITTGTTGIAGNGSESTMTERTYITHIISQQCVRTSKQYSINTHSINNTIIKQSTNKYTGKSAWNNRILVRGKKEW